MSERESGFNLPPGCFEADIPGWDETDEAGADDYEAAIEAALEREFREADEEDELFDWIK